MGVRLIAVWVALALILSGPLPPLALAQQPAEDAKPAAGTSRGNDVYDAGAVAITAIGMPLKGFVCVLGGGLGLALLVVTFGSAHKASTDVVRAGCDQKWIVHGDDIRPESPTSRAPEYEAARGEMK